MKPISVKTVEENFKKCVSADVEIGENDFLIYDEEIFGDGKEHPVSFLFFDGFAIGHSFNEESGEMLTIQMTYTKKADLTEKQKHDMRVYQGIPNPRDYTFRDIALYEGEAKMVNI